MSSGDREDRGRQRAEAQRRNRSTREQRIAARDEKRAARTRDDDFAGVVWARPEPGARRARLSRDDIAGAGLRIADAEGLDALSMRRVAGELGVGTMTLYYYVRDKGELLDLMQDAMMGEVILPDGELPADWRGALHAIARRSHAAFRRHPWVLAAPPSAVGPNGMRHFEQSLQAVAALPIDFQARLEIIFMLDDYVFGSLFREVEQAAGQASALNTEAGRDAMPDYLETLIAGGEFPNLARLRADAGSPRAVLELLESAVNDAGRFDRGLERLLDGIALGLESERP